MKKIFILSAITLLFIPSCLLFSQKAESTPEPIPPSPIPVYQPSFEKGLTPEYQDIVQKLDDASLYSIKFIIADDMYHITGSEEVNYTNNEDVDLDEIQFRLFPNILGGEMTVDNVKVNGSNVTPKYKLNNSLLILPLKKPLAPKETVTLSMDFSVTVPQNVDLNYGVQAYYEKCACPCTCVSHDRCL